MVHEFAHSILSDNMPPLLQEVVTFYEGVQKAWTSSFRIGTIKRLEQLLFLNWRRV